MSPSVLHGQSLLSPTHSEYPSSGQAPRGLYLPGNGAPPALELAVSREAWSPVPVTVYLHSPPPFPSRHGKRRRASRVVSQSRAVTVAEAG